ncbi:DUF397 domain-containing protein [Streptomyces hydrogenans]|uniref:DUF397 domain-containing protein n=1 Tax=Streptomyces hydrogenans TaxID=1873719 RepID=UPI00363E284B
MTHSVVSPAYRQEKLSMGDGSEILAADGLLVGDEEQSRSGSMGTELVYVVAQLGVPVDEGAGVAACGWIKASLRSSGTAGSPTTAPSSPCQGPYEHSEREPFNVPVRDGKKPTGPVVTIDADAWTAFLRGLRRPPVG